MREALTILTLIGGALTCLAATTPAWPQTSDAAAVFESAFSGRDFDLTADPNRAAMTRFDGQHRRITSAGPCEMHETFA